jgi:hypothetical protein
VTLSWPPQITYIASVPVELQSTTQGAVDASELGMRRNG